MYICHVCNEEFMDEDFYTYHYEVYHNAMEVDWEPDEDTDALLGDEVQDLQDLQEEPTQNRPSVIQYAPPREVTPMTIVLTNQALERSVVRHYRIENCNNLELNEFLSEAKKLVTSKLQEELRRLNFMKFGLLVDTLFVNCEDERSNRGFISRNRSVMVTTDLDSVVEECLQEIILKITEHEARGSGWSLEALNSMDLRVHKRGYGERGSSYIPLPQRISHTKSCINVKNENDNECFKYAMLVKHMVSKGYDHLERPNRQYQELTHTYNFNGITYPVSLDDVKSFEKRNVNVSVNVFGLDSRNNVFPLKVVQKELRDHTDLLLIKDDCTSHYVYIKDFNKLVANQLSKRQHKVTVCKRCFNFSHKDPTSRDGSNWIAEHSTLCCKTAPVKVQLPNPWNSCLQFNSPQQQYRIPIVVYADFESCLIPVETTDPDEPRNGKYQKHVPNSYCFIVKSTLPEEHLRQYDIPIHPVLYRGKDAAAKFVSDLYEVAQKVSFLYSYVVPMKPLSDLQMLWHLISDVCYLCKKPFTYENHKVHDHDHLTGEYRGPACNSCNLSYKLPKFIPVVLHNLSGYDAHFIVPELGRDHGSIDVIAQTTEKFISFSKKVCDVKLRFLDSLRFMPFSLMTLSSNLERKDLIETSKIVSQDKIDLVLRKGVFPYDYIDSFDKFDETSLPPKEMFYNKLNDTSIKKKDYDHAVKVWNELGMETLGDYSDFYVKLDVTLLCDVMEEFRNACMMAYGLDPFHFYTSPGLAWQAMMKETNCTLQLLTDIDMVLMVENGIRGGLTQAILRHVKANNKYIHDYRPEEESVYIGYFDANNLYGWAMSMPLPYGGFGWVDPTKIGDISQIPKHGDLGYIIDFDFIYPDELHDKHFDLPLLPVHDIPPLGKHPKLLTTLDNKQNYIAHFWSVQQAIEFGIVITKINRVLQFTQRCWLKPYIDSNTARRAAATSKFHKEFFKGMNNSVYGKTLENKRNHMDLKLVSDRKKLEKLVRKPNFKTSIIINENLVAVCMNKTNILMNRPIYVGMSVLDISKTHMYDFHYNKMVDYYGRDNITISYMDTDAFVYKIKTEDMYEDIKTFPHENEFDFSDYPANHPLHNLKNKKLLGKFKDETNGAPILELVALMSKMYSMRIVKETPEHRVEEEDDEEKEVDNVIKKAKGIKKIYLEKKVKFDHYYNCLFNDVNHTAEFNTIRSFNHNLFSLTQTKKALSAVDDKRVIMEDKVQTLPYGHRLLRN